MLAYFDFEGTITSAFAKPNEFPAGGVNGSIISSFNVEGNALGPMNDTLLGIVIDSIGQSSKALPPMEETDWGSNMLSNPQPLKELLSIVLTLLGNDMSVRLLQLIKAPAPIRSTVSGMTTPFKKFVSLHLLSVVANA